MPLDEDDVKELKAKVAQLESKVDTLERFSDRITGGWVVLFGLLSFLGGTFYWLYDRVNVSWK